MIKYMNLIPAAFLFLRFFGAFLRWSTNVIQDGHVTPDEVIAGVKEFWPKRDAFGEPEAIKIPWVKSSGPTT